MNLKCLTGAVGPYQTRGVLATIRVTRNELQRDTNVRAKLNNATDPTACKEGCIIWILPAVVPHARGLRKPGFSEA